MSVFNILKENIIPIIVLIMSIGATFFAYNHHKKVKKELEKIKKSKKKNFIGELKKLEKSKKTNEKKLNELSDLSKKYFEEQYCIKKDLTFSEIIEKTKDKKIEEYNKKIEEVLYSGNSITKKELSNLFNLLEKIMKKNH